MDAALAPVEVESKDLEDSEERAGSDEDKDEDEDEEDDEGMPDELKKIQNYLLTLKRPVRMSNEVYDSFRQFAFKFRVHEGLLCFRNKVNIPPTRVF